MAFGKQRCISKSRHVGEQKIKSQMEKEGWITERGIERGREGGKLNLIESRGGKVGYGKR